MNCHPDMPVLPLDTPQKEREIVLRWFRAMRRRGAPATQDAALFVLDNLDSTCTYCGGPGGCFDHITPIQRGGQSVPENLAPCCRTCNARKHNHSVFTFCLDLAAERQAARANATFDLPRSADWILRPSRKRTEVA